MVEIQENEKLTYENAEVKIVNFSADAPLATDIGSGGNVDFAGGWDSNL